jgi:hypothetical protein
MKLSSRRYGKARVRVVKFSRSRTCWLFVWFTAGDGGAT